MRRRTRDPGRDAHAAAIRALRARRAGRAGRRSQSRPATPRRRQRLVPVRARSPLRLARRARRGARHARRDDRRLPGRAAHRGRTLAGVEGGDGGDVTRRVRIAVFVPALVVLFALLLWGFAGMPDFGHYRGPYGFVLERIATPERHVTNVVNATTYDYRGFDTMGEEFILFAAVTGVVLLLRGSSGSRRRADDDVRSDSIRAAGAVAPALVILVGLWLVAFGFVTPGGGFQGGVAVAAGALMLF